MKPRAFSILVLLTCLVGCGSHTESYSVRVKNETSQPLTIGFTKEGEPFQDEFMSPEDLAIDRQINPETHSWGILLPAGQTKTTAPGLKAELQGDSISYLRVYRGHLNLLQILAISRGSPSRLDAPLMDGKNDFVIIERNGKLALSNGP